MVTKVTARVFASSSPGGGNPVTVFLSKSRLSDSFQTRLARECAWESVVVEMGDSSSSAVPHVWFYMPSGETVSFCAHAAMGAAYSIAKESSGCADHTVLFQTNSGEKQRAVFADKMVGLQMRSTFSLEPISRKETLGKLLQEIGVEESSLCSRGPSLLNASVAGRPKTLFRLSSIEAVHGAQSPSDPGRFQYCCDEIESTGVYLYAPHPEVDYKFECRQFPRASGYPEDPATGIAAAALAVGLHQYDNSNGESCNPTYTFIQGTAMGRPSLIKIQDIQMLNGESENATVSLTCWGQLDVDSIECIRAL